MINRNPNQINPWKIVQAASSSSQKPKLGQTQTEDELLEERYNQSQLILDVCAVKWPSMSVIQKPSEDWTIPSLKARINELKNEHRNQLVKCVKHLKLQEDALLDETHMMCEDVEPWGSPSIISDVKRMYAVNSHITAQKGNDFLVNLRLIQFETLKPLYKKLRELQTIEDRAKHARAKMFPKSTQAWRDMDTKDAKLAVTRFVMLDKKQQEDHLNRNKIWKDSKADVDNLCSEYENNVVFAQEVKVFLKENETTDPRKKVQ